MLETLEKIMKIYGETNSLEGTYDLFLKIKQYLERFEALNKVWHDNEPMESVDINANHLQELYDFINKLMQENEKLKNENEILKMSVKDTYDSANDMIFELQEELKKLKTLDNERVELLGNLNAELSITEKENKEIWQQIENYNHKFAEVERKKCDLILENEKLKKAFKILTQRIVIKAHKNFLFGGRHLDIASTTIKLTDEEYELLKEVLGNEEN